MKNTNLYDNINLLIQKLKSEVKLVREVLSQARGATLSMLIILEACLPRRRRLAVSYAWAKKGDRGGPFVKIDRLERYFPRACIGYNVLYTLSNHDSFNKSAYIFLKKNGIRIVHNQNGVYYPAWYTGNWREKNRRMAIPYSLADVVLYQSQFCKKSAEIFLGESAAQGEILYNAVDTGLFRPYTTVRERTPDNRVFLITGNFVDQMYYRIESSILAFHAVSESMKGARLHIAGYLSQSTNRNLRELCRKLNLTGRVDYLGPYTQEDAPRIYNEADIYLMTKHNDPCPNVVIEAMSCGLPVVYSCSGGVPELVGESAGIGVSCKFSWTETLTPSPDDLAAAMKELSGDSYRDFSKAARERAVKLFDLKGWIARHDAIFRDSNSKP